MKSCLIKIPQDTSGTAAKFEDVLVQLHETLRGQKVALEIIATAQNIGLCFTADDATAEVIAGQIYSMAPHADIMEIADLVEEVDEDAQCISVELGLSGHDLRPLKDYTEFKGDSLSGVLSVLSKCRPGEMVLIQIALKPRTETAHHHLIVAMRKAIDRILHVFRVKFWFKRTEKGKGQTVGEKIADKALKRLFLTNIRVAVISTDPEVKPDIRLEAVYGALANFNTLDHNQLKARRLRRGPNALQLFKKRTIRRPFFLSTAEVATIYHLPDEKESPNLLHVISSRQAPPRELPTTWGDPEISFFGESNFRDERIPFGIKREDRRRHLYVVGKSGSGKSKLLELLIKNDIEAGHGVGVLDPHGDLVDNCLRIIPEHRIKDVVVFDPSDLLYPPSFNPLEEVPEEMKMRVTIGFIEIFQKLFGNNWGQRLEHCLRYTTLALLDTPGTTILSVLKMLTDKRYRQGIVANIRDNVVKNFWVSEFAAWAEKYDGDAITPLVNRVGQLVATNMIRNILGQPINRFDFRKFMDEKKIVFIKVPKGILGEENSDLLGAIFITKIYQGAMGRADTPEHLRKDFYFYVDEFQNFATDTFDEILTEARKYRLNLTIAHQFLGQLNPTIRKTVFGNVGSMISFRCGAEDAQIMADEFKPRFTARDIINLGVRDFCLKMSIDGEMREAFSGRTINVEPPEEDNSSQCIAHSRQYYARPVEEVENILQRWEEGDMTVLSQNGHGPGPELFEEEPKLEEPLL